MDFLKEMYAFLRLHKKLWLMPIVLLLIALAALLLIAQSTAFAPFIYTIF